MKIAESLKNPPSQYRPVPFWSWNDKLEQKELDRQIRLMKEAGLGGFFMHARGGLQTEYASPEWFNLVSGCVGTAEKLDMNAWAYDENGWPSGFGNGAVNGLGLSCQQKYLRFSKMESPEKIQHPVAFYDRAGKLLPDAAGAVSAAYFDVNPYYVDTLDGDVTRKFIEAVYQKYYDILPPERRSAMRGFFTDEPQISRNGIPWSFKLEAEYRKEWGAELLNDIPGLFSGAFPNAKQIRFRFWKTVGRMFSANFMKPIYDWCSAHGWALTGHLVLEDTYLFQITTNGTAMPHYRYFTIPGMDALGRWFTHLFTPMQVASVAAQTGKKQILSETFACCGWGVTFADLKWLAQWQMVHGINLICQHLEGYSLRGIRKRDYPASLFAHQPWWKFYRLFNDPVSRMGMLLAEGEIRTDVLLVHGISTAHMLFEFTTPDLWAKNEYREINLYSDAFEALSKTLDCAHIPHHYGDETLMEELGSVEGKSLRIGKQSYSVVILPKLANLSAKQFEMLKKFAESGGILLGRTNDLDRTFCIDGVEADPAPLFKKVRFFDSDEALAVETAKHAETLSIVEADTYRQAGKINAACRRFHDFDGKPAVLYWYVNTERFEKVDAEAIVKAGGVERFNPETGLCEPVYYEKDMNGICRVPHAFEPAGDFALIAREFDVKPASPEVGFEKRLEFPHVFELAGCTGNLLTIDRCTCIADGRKLFENEYVLSVQDALLAFERPVDTVLEYEFTADQDYEAGSPLSLLAEHPERCEIEVNGHAVSNVSSGFVFDPAFERIEIGKFIKTGKNVIRLKTRFSQTEQTYAGIRASKLFEGERNKLSFHSEVEAVYLYGKFGVRTDPAKFRELPNNAVRYSGTFSLSKQPETVNPADTLGGGFPFFAGTMTLSGTVRVENPDVSCGISFGKVFAHAVEVRVNGRSIGILTRPDYTLKIPAGVLRKGENKLEIALTGSLRNMLGVFHLEEGEALGVGPASFYRTKGVFLSQDNPRWDSNFCFLKFGFEV